MDRGMNYLYNKSTSSPLEAETVQYTFTILLQLFERAALLLMCLFVLTRLPRFKEIFQKEHTPRRSLP